jgi:hypothetical protein
MRKPVGGTIDESKGAVREMCIEDFTMEEELELMREAIVEDTTEKNWNMFGGILALICSGMSSAKEIAERFAVPEELIESLASKIGMKLPPCDE